MGSRDIVVRRYEFRSPIFLPIAEVCDIALHALVEDIVTNLIVSCFVESQLERKG